MRIRDCVPSGPCPVAANRVAAGVVARNPVLGGPDSDAAAEGAAHPARRDLQKWAVGGRQTPLYHACPKISILRPLGSVIVRSCAISCAVSDAYHPDSGSTTRSRYAKC